MEWKDIITFWFEDAGEKKWYAKDPAFDELIRSTFEDIHGKISNGEMKSWRNEPLGRLAEIIVLDQFSRNMFRGTPRAFQYDAQALSLAEEAVAVGADLGLPPEQRAFMYLPYMHSESKDVHTEALKLFTMLGEEGNLKYEQLHKDIIDRFGRYPSRNAVLGRTSTPEELEFLKTHPGF